ncbi:dienelactone hydrolase family protein [Thalassotalea fusca]
MVIQIFTTPKLHFLLFIVVLVMGAPVATAKDTHDFPPTIKASYLPVKVGDEKNNLILSGVLKVPENDAKIPAVLILHGSAGIDNRGQFYADKLNQQGIATFEIDLWGGRGLTGGSKGRPALPTLTVPDALAALSLLANRDEIDSKRIGVIGFSWGGVIAMLLKNNATYEGYDSAYRFSAFVAHYPVCWAYNNVPGVNFNDLSDGAMLIQTGELDDYDKPESCPTLIASLPSEQRSQIEVKVWPDAYHAWDRFAPTIIVDDPFSHQGKGGNVTLSANVETAKQSRNKAVTFFKRYL